MMKEATVSQCYAKSIYQLGHQQGTDIAEEFTKITEAINQSNHLEAVLFLDVFSLEEKSAVLDQIVDRLKLSALAKNALKFLMGEGRIGLFPLIFKELVVLDDQQKGFLRGSVEGSDDALSAEFEKAIYKYLGEKLSAEIKLDYRQNPQITAGHRVTVGDFQWDISLDYQLNRLKAQVLNS